MSSFSDVDASGAVGTLAAYLERTERSMSPLKSYVVTAAACAAAGGVVVDLGCGLGFDLARLDEAGLRPIGIDASQQMLLRAQGRVGETSPLTQADAASLPLRDASIDGCRIERVLQHVADPDAVVTEVARVVRSGGFVAVLEPDFGQFRVDSDVVPDGDVPARLLQVRHPRIGGDLVTMLEAVGFRVEDVVTESSRGYRFDGLPVHTETVIDRAVEDGRFAEADAARWLAEQRARTTDGTFRATWDKVLVVARRK